MNATTPFAVEERFRVFARARAGEPLAQIGVVRAPTPVLAYLYARQNYTEQHWDELAVVPEGAFWSGLAATRERDGWLVAEGKGAG